MRRCVYKKIHYLTFDLDLGVKVTQNIIQYPLHCVIYASTKFEVATSNSLGEDTITRNVTDRRTDRRTDGRTTDRLWYEIYIPFFSNEKAGIKNSYSRPLFTLHNGPSEVYGTRLVRIFHCNRNSACLISCSTSYIS